MRYSVFFKEICSVIFNFASLFFIILKMADCQFCKIEVVLCFLNVAVLILINFNFADFSVMKRLLLL